MREKFGLRRPSPAMVVALVAVILACGGSAYAGSKISFGELSKGAKVKTEGVGPLAFVKEAVTIPSVANGTTATFVGCPNGLSPVGGGVALLTGFGVNPATFFVQQDYPFNNGWQALVFNNTGSPRSVTTIVACARSRLVTGLQ
jgi:hypothetical protein